MNDRDLLELAAKAAGIEIEGDYAPTFGFYSLEEGRGWRYWNPLHNDGDALRLAARLRISVNFFEGFEEVKAETYMPDGDVFEKYGSSVHAATRRAIVRAAAEIGRGEGV